MKQGNHSDRDRELYLKSIRFKGLTAAEKTLLKKEESKFRDIKRKYNLNKEQYLKMIDNQNGLCLGCGKAPKKLCIDHCHSTGKVRGILCSDCNVALGLLKDDPNTLRNLMHYLIRHS